MLQFTASGALFASGALTYEYVPAPSDITPRIIMPLQVEGVRLRAIVDTGAPYVVINPQFAESLGIERDNALEQIQMNIRGDLTRGGLHRLTIQFQAAEGEDLWVVATAFVPDTAHSEGWGDHPSYIGMTGCLERLRFAIDPGNDKFYFGEL